MKKQRPPLVTAHTCTIGAQCAHFLAREYFSHLIGNTFEPAFKDPLQTASKACI